MWTVSYKVCASHSAFELNMQNSHAEVAAQCNFNIPLKLELIDSRSPSEAA